MPGNWGYNNMVVKKCFVDLNSVGMRLDKFLGGRFTYHSRTEWQGKIERGIIKVNGKKAKVKTRLKTGDEIVYQALDLVEPPVDAAVKVLYDDGDLIVVNKTGNLPVIPSGSYHDNTLYSIMYKRLGQSPKLINRIDRETSGCIMMARSEKMAKAMQADIRSYKKTYIALVKGELPQKSFSVEGNIGVIGHEWYKQLQGFCDEGKYSKTDFYRIKSAGEYSLLFCRLHTGRMHQIRVHLNSLGIYILGDKIYGEAGPYMFKEFLENGNSKKVLDNIELGRQALHSYKLVFPHPFKKERVIINAPIPPDIKGLAKEKGLLPIC